MKLNVRHFVLIRAKDDAASLTGMFKKLSVPFLILMPLYYWLQPTDKPFTMQLQHLY
jgi:hypothetical protein